MASVYNPVYTRDEERVEAGLVTWETGSSMEEMGYRAWLLD